LKKIKSNHCDTQLSSQLWASYSQSHWSVDVQIFQLFHSLLFKAIFFRILIILQSYLITLSLLKQIFQNLDESLSHFGLLMTCPSFFSCHSLSSYLSHCILHEVLKILFTWTICVNTDSFFFYNILFFHFIL
jgi:hypothetical protein